MPAASDPGALPALPYTYRPMGARFTAIGLAVALFVAGAATWLTFDAETKAMWTLFQKSTVIVLFLFVVVLVHCLARCRVDAREDGLTIVNGYRRHDYDWAQVVAVNMDRGAPWATFDLSDGETVSAIAIQSADGERAVTAVRNLRALAARQTGQ